MATLDMARSKVHNLYDDDDDNDHNLDVLCSTGRKSLS